MALCLLSRTDIKVFTSYFRNGIVVVTFLNTYSLLDFTWTALNMQAVFTTTAVVIPVCILAVEVLNKSSR